MKDDSVTNGKKPTNDSAVGKHNEEVPNELAVARQNSKDSLDGSQAELEKEQRWNKRAVLTNDSAVNERNERLSTVNDPQQGIKGINPLWPLYEEQLRKQVRRLKNLLYALSAYRRRLESFEGVLTTLRGDWNTFNDESSEVAVVFAKASERHEYYLELAANFSEIGKQATECHTEIKKIGQEQRKGSINEAMPTPPAKHGKEYMTWCRRVGQSNLDSPTTQQLYQYRHATVQRYISRFRRGQIATVLPVEAQTMTVEDALLKRRVGGVNIVKLLTDRRDKFRR